MPFPAENGRMQAARGRPGALDHPLNPVVGLLVLALLAAFPFVAALAGADFYVSVASRMLIFALAATSLNLILGFGGMVSFGHAAFVGVGAYTVGILMQAGVVSAWIAWPAAALAAAAAALVIGAVSLRTQGVYFIMITLAFAQMVYFLAVSLKRFGGEDGMSLAHRSRLDFAAGVTVDLASDRAFYFVVLAICTLAFVLMVRLLNARFGHALLAIRENATRMEALGFPVLRIRLAAFALAGGVAGLAGALVANHSAFVSPAMMQWSQSGMLMIMVILGGVGHLWGGVVGALVFLLMEEVFSRYTVHWQFFLGAVLLLVVLIAPNGIMSLTARQRRV